MIAFTLSDENVVISGYCIGMRVLCRGCLLLGASSPCLRLTRTPQGTLNCCVAVAAGIWRVENGCTATARVGDSFRSRCPPTRPILEEDERCAWC